MARDPFAPVPQSSVPSWVWIVVGMIAVILVGIGSTVAIVVSKRSPPVVATTAPVAKPATDTPTTPITAATTATDTKPAADKPAGGDADKSDDGDKPEKKKKSHKPKADKAEKSAKADKPAAPAAPPPKKKSDMSQKDIDKLLGI